MENEREQEIEAEATSVDQNFGFDKNEVAEKSKRERVKVDEPKKSTFNISLNNLVMLLSLVSIALVLFGKLFGVIGVVIMLQICYWVGVVVLMGAMAVYLVQMFKDKKVEFNPQLVVMIVAIINTVFC